ncbi:MAG: TonB family protein [Alphaproteobacteria bacterium]|nr:TonB family protein [Alphaproteobacteria bacterium]
MAAVRSASRLAAVGLHLAGIGLAASLAAGKPPVQPQDIPITLTMVATPAPPEPAPRTQAVDPPPRPRPKPRLAARQTPAPQPPRPPAEPLPVIASAANEASPPVAAAAPPPRAPLPGTKTARQDYFSRLRVWLERHKRYPRHARTRRQQGTALVWFSMDRHGRVLDCRLQESSGFSELDEAAIDMVERAAPLPPFPKEITDASLELVVPADFSLR